MVRYRVEAFNTATASSNKIHDDAVARRFGFSGGLVPGVDVFAYLCHLPAERWGEAWLSGGTIEARFRTPVYDGDEADISGSVEPGAPDALELSLRDPGGNVCALGRAALAPAVPDGRTGEPGGPDVSVEAGAPDVPDTPVEAGAPGAPGGSELPVGAGAPDVPDVGLWPSGPPPAEDERPPVDAETLRSIPLGSVAATFRADKAVEYLDDVRESLPLFRDGGVAHPGWLLRFANSILVANVALGPWIHTQSRVQFLGLVGDGDRVETRALVTDLHERRGHQLVDLDVLQLVGDRPVTRIAHTAIYRLRESDS